MAKVLIELRKPSKCPVCKRKITVVEPIPTICCEGWDFRCPYCRCLLPVRYSDIAVNIEKLEELFG